MGNSAVKNSIKAIRRWAWVAGVWLMFALGLVSAKTSPPEKSAPTFVIVSNDLVASGNTSARAITNTSATTNIQAFTLNTPAVYGSLFLDVNSLTQSKLSLPEREIEARKRTTDPPLWASDEVRGIRKKFRG